MEKKNIIINKTEFNIIKELIDPIQDAENVMNKCIMHLKSELKSAIIINDKDDFPQNVIRINSIVDVQTPFGLMKIQLVLPKDANSTQKRISILTPMGSALIGYAENDKIMWEFPNGMKEVQIIKVIQQ